MKNTLLLSRSAATLLLVTALCGSFALAQDAPLTPVTPALTTSKSGTHAQVIPERQENFVWENDLVAFRTFGPSVRPVGTRSGIDFWLKRTPGNNNGTEDDTFLYEAGVSRGCGGDGIWKNDTLYVADSFSGWKMISQTPLQTEFELSYDYDVDGDKIHEDKLITIKSGQRFFRSVSTFTRDGQPAALDIGIALPNDGGKASPGLGDHWIASWRTKVGYGVGTAVVVEAKVKQRYSVVSSDPKVSHTMLAVTTNDKGQVAWYSGYDWEPAGTTTKADGWAQSIQRFAASLDKVQ